MIIIGIDPGQKHAAIVAMEVTHGSRQILRHAEVAPEVVIDWMCNFIQEQSRTYQLAGMDDTLDFTLAIEMVESFGMAVGRETFITVCWIGRYIEAGLQQAMDVQLIPRIQIRSHLCKSGRAGDPNVRQALIDRYGAPGTKKQPGMTHGISKHKWSALGVVACVEDNIWPTLKASEHYEHLVS